MAVVTVRWFAVLREERGADEERIEVPEGTTLRALYEQLVPTKPAGRIPVAYARNQSYADPDDVLLDGDEVAFLPPLGGG